MKGASIPENGLNCVRCSACRLLPETDFERFFEELVVLDEASVPAPHTPEFEAWSRRQDFAAPVWIHCRKVGHRRQARLWRRCAEANAAPRWVLTEGGNKVLGAGNLTFDASKFERAFMRAVWCGAPKSPLVKLHGRDWLTLLAMGHRAGLQRIRGAVSRELKQSSGMARAARAALGIGFTEEQSAYILARYEAGRRREEFQGLTVEWVWPRQFSGRHRDAAQKKQRNEDIKAAIVEEVARRGPARTYDAIRRHPEYKRPDYYATHKAALRERLAGNYQNNSLSRPQTRKTRMK